MPTYKLIFANNEVVTCDLLPTVILGKEYYLEHDKGKLIHVLVKAENENDALSKAEEIVKEFKEQIFGKDFIS